MSVGAKAELQDKKSASLGDILWTAGAFGLATGLLEGAGLLLFHGYGWGNTRIPEGVSARIVWISAAVNLGLFLLMGLGAFLAQRTLRKPWVMRATLILFAFMMFVDLLGVSGRIGPLGMIVFAAGVSSFVGRWFY